MNNISTYESVLTEVQAHPEWKYKDILEYFTKSGFNLQKYLDEGFSQDDVLFAMKRNIPLKHHICPVCGNEIHVYKRLRYPKACSVSCGVLGSQKLRHKLSLERYGVSSPQSRTETKEKIKLTMENKYGGYTFASKSLMKKVKATNLKKYGYEISGANKDLHKKNEQTCLQKYGVSHTSKLKENRKKAKQTNLERHGNANYNNKKQIEKTCLERYGVRNPIQCRDIRVKSQSKYLYAGLNFDSTWEIAYFIWLTDNNIIFEYQPAICFTYTYKGKHHQYNPDFKVGSMLVEIKGDQYFNAQKTKMVCPYNHQLDAKYNAKFKCMKKHGVTIFTKTQIQKYLDYVTIKYGSSYLDSFKRKLNLEK